MTKKYWKIECYERMKKLFEAKVPITYLSQKRLKQLINVLMAKFALTPEEILEEHLAIPFQSRKQHISISRTNTQHNGKTSINFIADSAGISIVAYLVEE